ncbi:hypothetical protein AB6A40_007502 [Gnathostoma spinigerum]|uniref:Secreted protein n=1 Tax=Gnathostoma spinigerum TaxID=75299 RepID=A0ABD6ELP0_9BILA
MGGMWQLVCAAKCGPAAVKWCSCRFRITTVMCDSAGDGNQKTHCLVWQFVDPVAPCSRQPTPSGILFVSAVDRRT